MSQECRIIRAPSQISHGEAGTAVDLDLSNIFRALHELIVCNNHRVEHSCCKDGNPAGGSASPPGGGGGGGGGGGCLPPFCPVEEVPNLTWGFADGTLLSVSGGELVPGTGGGGGAAYKTGALVSVVNTTTETDILNQSVTPGANGVIRVMLAGSRLYQTSTSTTTTLRIYLGGTLVYADNIATPSSSAAEAPWCLTFMVGWDGTTGYLTGMYSQGTQGGALAGIGDLGTGGFARSIGSNAFTLDPSIAVQVRVTAQHSLANATVAFTRRTAVIEVM